jgi:hypothetical protein
MIAAEMVFIHRIPLKKANPVRNGFKKNMSAL